MAYAKGFLSGIAGIYLASMLPPLVEVFKALSEQKASGLGAMAGGPLGSLLSPLFWIFAISFFAVFFMASRAGSRVLRMMFFWIPTVFLSTCTLSGLAYFVYSRRLSKKLP